MSETDNKTAKPNGVVSKNNTLDQNSDLYSGSQNHHDVPDDTLMNDSIDLINDLDFLNFDDEPLRFHDELMSSDKQPTSFDNQPTSFDSQPSSFDNQPSSFDSQPSSFDNQPSSFDNQPSSFDNQPTSFDSQPTTFDNQPTSFDNQLSYNENSSASSLQETNLLNTSSQSSEQNDYVSTITRNSILYGNRSNFTWSSSNIIKENTSSFPNENLAEFETSHESNAARSASPLNHEETIQKEPFLQDAIDEPSIFNSTVNQFEQPVQDNQNDSAHAPLDDFAFNELYDIPSPASIVPSQAPLIEELPSFNTDINFFDEPLEKQEPYSAVTDDYFLNTEEQLKNSASQFDNPSFEKTTDDYTDSFIEPVHKDIQTSTIAQEEFSSTEPLNDATIPNVPEINTPVPQTGQKTQNRTHGTPISYDLSQYNRILPSQTNKKSPNQPQPEEVVSVENTFNVSTDNIPTDFSEPESLNNHQFEQLLDGLDDELSMIFDDPQKHQNSRPNNDQHSSVFNQPSSSPQPDIYVPEMEPYQFDNVQVEKTEAFDIPSVNYDEQEKNPVASFDNDFEDVFNVGTKSNNDILNNNANTSNESNEEFYNSVTEGKEAYNSYNSKETLSDQSDIEMSDWDIFNENTLYSTNQEEWADSGVTNSYQKIPQKRGAFKKVLISVVCLIIIALLGSGAYYYFTKSSQSGEAQIIHADNSPIKVLPEVSPEQNTSGNTNGQLNTNAPQQELVDTSETPQILDSVTSNQNTSNAYDTPVDTNPASSPNVEAALSSGTNNSVPTNTTIAVVVKPDGSVVTERVPAAGTQTPATDNINNSGTMMNASSDNATTSPVNTQQVTPAVETQQTPGITTNPQLPESQPVEQDSSTQSSVSEALKTEPEQIIIPDRSLIPSNTETVQQVQTMTQPQATSETQAAGGFYVQLSSQPDETLAQSEMNKLQARYEAILGGRRTEIQRAVIEGRGTYYRVRVPAGSRENANSLCQSIQANGGSCFITR